MRLEKKLISKFLTISIDINTDIKKKIIKFFLSSISDFIHLNLRPKVIAIKKGIKKGMINL